VEALIVYTTEGNIEDTFSEMNGLIELYLQHNFYTGKHSFSYENILFLSELIK
jgi:hypothetical protein